MDGVGGGEVERFVMKEEMEDGKDVVSDKDWEGMFGDLATVY